MTFNHTENELVKTGDVVFVGDKYMIIYSGEALYCRLCGMVSYSKGDVLNKYCANCKRFLEDDLND